jgi:hypothetical protein
MRAYFTNPIATRLISGTRTSLPSRTWAPACQPPIDHGSCRVEEVESLPLLNSVNHNLPVEQQLSDSFAILGSWPYANPLGHDSAQICCDGGCDRCLLQRGEHLRRILLIFVMSGWAVRNSRSDPRRSTKPRPPICAATIRHPPIFAPIETSYAFSRLGRPKTRTPIVSNLDAGVD